jgi:hypothetical protein
VYPARKAGWQLSSVSSAAIHLLATQIACTCTPTMTVYRFYSAGATNSRGLPVHEAIAGCAVAWRRPIPGTHRAHPVCAVALLKYMTGARLTPGGYRRSMSSSKESGTFMAWFTEEGPMVSTVGGSASRQSEAIFPALPHPCAGCVNTIHHGEQYTMRASASASVYLPHCACRSDTATTMCMIRSYMHSNSSARLCKHIGSGQAWWPLMDTGEGLPAQPYQHPLHGSGSMHTCDMQTSGETLLLLFEQCKRH